jgi:hypothetical protein
MNCKQVKKIICEYLGGCLPDSLRKEVELHLVQCSECSAELNSVEDMVSCLRSLSHRSPIDCWPGIRERIQTQQTRWFWPRIAEILLRPAVAAPAFVVMLLLALFLLWPINVNEPPSRRSDPGLDYSRLITVHSRTQQPQVFADPDVILVSAELANSRAVANTDQDR